MTVMNEKVDQNYEWYCKNYQSFPMKPNDEWVIVNEKKFVASFETWDEAVAYAKKFKLEDGYIIQNPERDAEPLKLGFAGLFL